MVFVREPRRPLAGACSASVVDGLLIAVTVPCTQVGEVCGGSAPRSDCNIHRARRDLDAVWPRGDRESISPA